MRCALRVALLLPLSAAALACGDDSSDSGGPGPVLEVMDEEDASAPPSDMDAGADEDAGTGIPPVCENVDVIQGAGTAADGLNATALPDDFEVSRVSIGFDCETRSLVLKHSGGFCPSGDGHELTIALDAASIESGTLPSGPITLDALRSGITIRYTRHAFLDPGGEWGNCGTDDMGLLELLEMPSLQANQVVEGRYQLILVPCDGRLNEPIDVVGSFRALTDHSLAETCD